MNNIPRPEHPTPQWERKNWINLNGEWEFDFDFGRSARDRKLYESDEPLSRTITVPFCPESELSGIGYTDFIPAVCYRRKFNINESQLSGRVNLHFGAVDYKTVVFVNGKYVGYHHGGYTSFSFDITSFVNTGENTVLSVPRMTTEADYKQAESSPRGMSHLVAIIPAPQAFGRLFGLSLHRKTI